MLSKKAEEFAGYVGNKGIVVHISDPGRGFDYKKEIENRISGHRERRLTKRKVLYLKGDSDYYPCSGGTGIYCLLRFSSEFKYNEAGNEIIARFDLQ